MQIIVDSGSTKSNWVLLDGQNHLNTQQLEGFNPTSNPESLKQASSWPFQDHDISRITFYSSGINNTAVQKEVSSLLASIYNTSHVECLSDIYAAYRCLNKTDSTLVSILGTGVNTVCFEHNKIADRITSLGYIIGSEGSGFNIGRMIVKNYLRNNMQPTDSKAFEDMFKVNKTNLVNVIYKQAKPNFYIGQFTKFLNNSSEALKTEILNKNFHAYFKNQIVPLCTKYNYPLNVIGSVAKHYEDHLRKIGENYNINIERIIKDPLEGLIEFHKNKVD